MVITCIPTETVEDPEDEGQARIAALRRERENRRRYDCVVNWCEAFGVVRRFERKDDGSIHVYWRDWEVADMVSAFHSCARAVGRFAFDGTLIAHPLPGLSR